MRALGPYPRQPVIAVAFSGGPDSSALLHLMLGWAERRHGHVVALVVDHGLRAGSAGEAAAAAATAEGLGAEAAVLAWRGPKPATAIQAEARQARYRLLREACRWRGLLFLATGHHADDQAETVLLRLESGSGLSGLAGIGRVAVLDELLVLRPLLTLPKARLRAHLRAAGLDWTEDPTNHDARHRRVALRRLEPALGAVGLDRARLVSAASLFGRLRRRHEAAVQTLLAAAVTWRPGGYAELGTEALLAGPPPLAETALATVLQAVGGGPYPPGGAGLRRCLAALAARDAATLGGCRLLPGGGRVRVVREERGPPRLALPPGTTLLWDRRFRLRLGSAIPTDLEVGPLTRRGWQAVADAVEAPGLPGPALWSLPCVFDRDGPRALPTLGWQRRGAERLALRCRFQPAALPGRSLFAVA